MPPGQNRKIVGDHGRELGERPSRRGTQQVQVDLGPLRQVLVERHHLHRAAAREEVRGQRTEVDAGGTRSRRTDHHDRAVDEVAVAVMLEPVQCRGGAASTIDGR